jgi:Flp pilus assembly protein TadD
MSNSLRFGTALSALTLATTLTGCATWQSGGRAAGLSKAQPSVGLATRAVAALNSNDLVNAVSFAEAAVEQKPEDASLRALLGNAYFAAGRFASAEATYRDSLSLSAAQPKLVLKLALVQIAQGKRDEALALLSASGAMLDAADFGLAVALAGRATEAVSILSDAARRPGADARLRQNLALAYALDGDWTAARTVAEQDLSPDLVDQRVQQWMSFAKPARAPDQVAALTGVTPAAFDPGQPTRLALRTSETRTAEVQSAPQPQAQAAAPVLRAPAPAVPQAAVAPAAIEVPLPVPAPTAVATAEADAAPAFVAADSPPAEPVAEPEYVAPRQRAAIKAASAKVAKLVRKPASLPRRSGNSTAVVQLGAYGSPQRVAAAWTDAARRFTVLRAYSPMSARFNSPQGLVYRLSVRGFGSAREAAVLCASLRKAGGKCFVRTVAGDAPVRIASR